MPFNPDFAEEEGKYLIGQVRVMDVFIAVLEQHQDKYALNVSCSLLQPRIGVVANLVYNFNIPILQCSCTVYNPEVIGKDGALSAFDLTSAALNT